MSLRLPIRFNGKRPSGLKYRRSEDFVCKENAKNCVSSCAIGFNDHTRISAFPLVGSVSESLQKIKRAVLEITGTRLVKEEMGKYFHFECESEFFGFIDDLEFSYYPNDPERIHVKSASRLGVKDFDVNRKRIDKIRDLYAPKKRV